MCARVRLCMRLFVSVNVCQTPKPDTHKDDSQDSHGPQVCNRSEARANCPGVCLRVRVRVCERKHKCERERGRERDGSGIVVGGLSVS